MERKKIGGRIWKIFSQRRRKTENEGEENIWRKRKTWSVDKKNGGKSIGEQKCQDGRTNGHTEL